MSFLFELLMNSVTLIALALAVTTPIWLALSLMLAWENRRFSFSRMNQQCKIRPREHRTWLIVPCKGDDGDLANNLKCFFNQRHPNYELVLVVESPDDPAYRVIQRMKSRYPNQDCRVVVAGVAKGDGQKVHNLLVATETIDPSVKVLAFADADIRPELTWLQTLCFSVCKAKNAAANTGYRWMLPTRYSLVNLLVYSINATIAGSMGSGGHLLVWGGSWSIRRSNFDRLGIREGWQGTLSDDLVATDIIQKQGERVIYDPRCLCVTNFDLTWTTAVEFLRRQYVIARHYAGRMYWGGYLLLGATVITWWVMCVLAIARFGTTLGTACAGGVALFFLVGVAKGFLRQAIFRRRNYRLFSRYRAAARFDIWASPLVMTFNFAMMTTAIFGNCIRWRGNHYRIHRGGQIEVLDDSLTFESATGVLPVYRKSA